MGWICRDGDDHAADSFGKLFKMDDDDDDDADEADCQNPTVSQAASWECLFWNTGRQWLLILAFPDGVPPRDPWGDAAFVFECVRTAVFPLWSMWLKVLWLSDKYQ